MSELRLLWSISHPTLARSDVPALRGAGFRVTQEEPELSVLDPVGIEELTLGIPQPPELEGPNNLRLWPKLGRLAPNEIELANSYFDVIVVSTIPRIAIEVSRWFRGVTIYRDFGELPWVLGNRATGDELLEFGRVLHCPISPHIHSPLAQLSRESILLRTTIPAPVSSANVEVIQAARTIGVFLGGRSTTENREFLQQLHVALPLNSKCEVRIFGLGATDRAIFERLFPAFTLMPRLANEMFQTVFSQLSVLIYPHESKNHSHYTPYEAIALGIPTLLLRGTPISLDWIAGNPGEDPQCMGIYSDVTEMLGAFREILDEGPNSVITGSQSELLRAQSAEVVMRQADQLFASIKSNAQFQISTGPLLTFQSETLPRLDTSLAQEFESRKLRQNFHPYSCVVPSTLGEYWHSEFTEAGTLGEHDSCLRVSPGPNLEFVLPRLGIEHFDSAELTVRFLTDHELGSPIRISLSTPDGDYYFMRLVSRPTQLRNVFEIFGSAQIWRGCTIRASIQSMLMESSCLLSVLNTTIESTSGKPLPDFDELISPWQSNEFLLSELALDPTPTARRVFRKRRWLSLRIPVWGMRACVQRPGFWENFLPIFIFGCQGPRKQLLGVHIFRRFVERPNSEWGQVPEIEFCGYKRSLVRTRMCLT